MGEIIKEADSSEIDFKQEANNLESYFKPDPGTTKVEFMDNGDQQTRTYGEGDDKETRDVVVFAVTVDGKRKKWTVNKASSPSSLWGQLAKLGAERGGLVGEEITLIRNGTGTDTQYTVKEAADI